MGLLPDWQIERDITIEPFAASATRPGVISYGLSRYGYDVRVGRRFKVFTNAHCAVVDPKHFDPASFVDIEGDFCLIPPNSFALASLRLNSRIRATLAAAGSLTGSATTPG